MKTTKSLCIHYTWLNAMHRTSNLFLFDGLYFLPSFYSISFFHLHFYLLCIYNLHTTTTTTTAIILITTFITKHIIILRRQCKHCFLNSQKVNELRVKIRCNVTVLDIIFNLTTDQLSMLTHRAPCLMVFFVTCSAVYCCRQLPQCCYSHFTTVCGEYIIPIEITNIRNCNKIDRHNTNALIMWFDLVGKSIESVPHQMIVSVKLSE